MPDSYETITFQSSGGIATVQLNRPEAANAINLEMAKELQDAAFRCSQDKSIRAVVITGAGRFFSAGGDLKSFALGARDDEIAHNIKKVAIALHEAISLFTRLDAPVIAAVNGTAAGAGFSLACMCDIVVAAHTARFTMAYARAGLTPDGSITYYLPRIVGLKRAIKLTLTNRMLTAAEALELGLVTRVVPASELMDETMGLVQQLAAGPTQTFGAAMRLLRAGWAGTIETQMADEAHTIAEISTTHDGREGVKAFLEKRAPEFKGE